VLSFEEASFPTLNPYRFQGQVPNPDKEEGKQGLVQDWGHDPSCAADIQTGTLLGLTIMN